MRDPAAVGHRPDRGPQRGRVAGHLERDVEPLDHVELLERRFEGPLARVDGERGAHPGRDRAAVRVGLAHDHVTGARVARDGRGHQPDRAGAADQHVLAEDREGERGVDRVAERVEDRGDLLVDARPVVPDVGHRQRDVLGERPVAPDAEADRVRRTGCAGRPGSGGSGRRPRGPRPTRGRPGWKSATLLPTSTISPTNSWPTTSGGWIVFARPRVPRLDVEVRAADAGLVDPDQDVVDADGRHRHVAQLEARAGVGLDQGEHRGACLRARRVGVEVVVGVVVVLGPVDDRILHRADAVDLAADPIARLEEDRRVAEDADTGRRAGRDDVAGLERDRRG